MRNYLCNVSYSLCSFFSDSLVALVSALEQYTEDPENFDLDDFLQKYDGVKLEKEENNHDEAKEDNTFDPS